MTEHRTKDILAILDVMSRYAWGMDRADRVAYESVWHEDASWTADGVAIDLHGKSAIMAYFDGTASARAAIPAPGSAVRLFSHPMIEFVAGDTATSRCELVAHRFDGGSIAAYSVGFYDDRLSRRNGAWKFEARHMTVNPPVA